MKTDFGADYHWGPPRKSVRGISFFINQSYIILFRWLVRTQPCDNFVWIPRIGGVRTGEKFLVQISIVVPLQNGLVGFRISLINTILSYSPGWCDHNHAEFTCGFVSLREIGAGGVSGLVVGC